MNVSIAVITYNSSDTIIYTLDSILNQQYSTKNIELIISDDGSEDNTVDIIDEWLDINSSVFLDVSFIKNTINKGVSANCNEAWKAASCEWIKSIAGDDILRPNCISDNVKYIENNPECKILFSKMRWFGNINKVTPSQYNMRFFKKNSAKQNNWLRFFSFNIAPTSFINREVLDKIGYADTSYRNIEDLPLWLKFTQSGYKLCFLDAVTVGYRASESITMSNHRYVNVDFLYDLISINNDQAMSFSKHPVNEFIRFEQLLMFKLTLLISNISGNKNKYYTNLLGRMTWIFRPVHLTRNIHVKFYNLKQSNSNSSY